MLICNDFSILLRCAQQIAQTVLVNELQSRSCASSQNPVIKMAVYHKTSYYGKLFLGPQH